MLVASLTLLFCASASAQQLSTGITYDFANGYHVVTVDLDSLSTEVRVSEPHAADTADEITVAAHAMQEGATVAINANYFGGVLNHPCGVARGFAKNYSDAYGEPVNCVTTLGWARGNAAIYDSSGHETDNAFMSMYSDAATGGGYLLSGGQRHDWNHAKLEVGRDCTAIGVSADRKKFVLVVTDATSCSGAGLQDALLAHGAADAIHLDGGGSSKMWIRGKGYVNDETQDRAPPNVVFARPNGDCPSDCGARRCLDLPKPYRAECDGQACRAGLATLWNCDVPKLRRVRCDGSGNVSYEYCKSGCMPMANGVDDVCAGGAIPEPAPDMASAPDMAATLDAAAQGSDDGGGNGGNGGNGGAAGGGGSSTKKRGGCSVSGARAIESRSIAAATAAILAGLVAMRRSRRRR
jgi:hypothetical protein